MQNEAVFKKIFCLSVKRDKGFTLKLAAPMFAGIPDIYCIYPNYMPVLLEAKWLGEVTDEFDRKIPFSALQLHWLEESNKVQQYSSFGITGFKHRGITYCVMTPWNVTQLDCDFKNTFPYCSYSPSTKLFDVHNLFTNSPIPVMNMQPIKELPTQRHYDIKAGSKDQLFGAI